MHAQITAVEPVCEPCCFKVLIQHKEPEEKAAAFTMGEVDEHNWLHYEQVSILV